MLNKTGVDVDTIPIARQELVIERVFDAPPDIVWRAWIEPKQLLQWWGPKGYAIIASKHSLHDGGIFHYGLRAPDGQEMWGRFVYIEAVPPEKLVFTNSFSDVTGSITRHPMNPSWPLEMMNTLIFTGTGQKTILTMKCKPHHATFEEEKAFSDNRENVKKGMAVTFEQLDRYLAGVLK
jgi:uncharacterized protein YndB with AHSA1/START domain